MNEDKQIAIRVAASQGKARVLLDSATDEEISELAALAGAEDLPAKFADWLRDYYDARKATVDEGE